MPLIKSEINADTRQDLVYEVVKVLQGEQAYGTVYVQPLVWGTGKNFERIQRPDNFFVLRRVTVD